MGLFVDGHPSPLVTQQQHPFKGTNDKGSALPTNGSCMEQITDLRVQNRP